jgi:hypothetical protein
MENPQKTKFWLSNILNTSWKTYNIQIDWKMAEIKITFKERRLKKLQQLQGISLLNLVCKICVKITRVKHYYGNTNDGRTWIP